MGDVEFEDMVDGMCVKYRSSCVQGGEGGEDIGLSRSPKLAFSRVSHPPTSVAARRRAKTLTHVHFYSVIEDRF